MQLLINVVFPITRAIPKEMLGILDKPLIHYAFEEAVAAGIEEFIFVTRHGKIPSKTTSTTCFRTRNIST